MKSSGGTGLAVFCAALAASSCGSHREVKPDVAGARVAELRARFPLQLDVATHFEAAAGPAAATHVRAVFPEQALRGVARPAHVALPNRAAGEVMLEDTRSGLSARFALDDVQNTHIELARGMALYPKALAGADVVHRVRADGTEDFVFFESRPSREELTYSLDVSQVAGLRLVSNTLELLDHSGTPVLRVAAPYVVDATRHRHAARLAVSGCAYDVSPAAPWGRSVTSAGASRCKVHVTWGDVAYPAMVDPVWSTTGSMAMAREGHAAALLPSGRALIVGGSLFMVRAHAAAELYDPAGAGSFAATGSMTHGRAMLTASSLPSGHVLVTGGEDSEPIPGMTPPYVRQDGEVYDPDTGTFVVTSNSMSATRMYHSATVLPSGKVLLAGGEIMNAPVDGADLFDPSAGGGAGAFEPTGSPLTSRSRHSATLLPSGKVLIAGGLGPGYTTLATSELFDPDADDGAGAFAPTGSLAVRRSFHTATLLPSGNVLVAGGYDEATAEIYDPVNGVFTFTASMSTLRGLSTATALPSGKVLLVGGRAGMTVDEHGSAEMNVLASTELFDPTGNLGTGSFTPSASLLAPRENATATLLPSGRLLLAGGNGGGWELDTAEVLGDECTSDASCPETYHCAADGRCLPAPPPPPPPVDGGGGVGGGVDAGADPPVDRGGDPWGRDSGSAHAPTPHATNDTPANAVLDDQSAGTEPESQSGSGGCAASGSRSPLGGSGLVGLAVALGLMLRRRRHAAD